MKKVFIVGLGLIGASYAEGLVRQGYLVYGYDKNLNVNQKALDEGLIISCDISFISQVDLVILALYPKDNVKFVKDNYSLFNANQLITDLSGTKEEMIKQIVEFLPNSIRYTSHHPMAGREKVGYDNKDYKMFNKANFLIVPTKNSQQEDYKVLSQLAADLGFGRVTIINPHEHDCLIAHTSQLTHLLAVALMNSDKLEQTKDATGDSYRDLTRIAKINEQLWAELFLANQHALVKKIDDFILSLVELKDDISSNNRKQLINKLKSAKIKRVSFDET